jgi:hypothetical protein
MVKLVKLSGGTQRDKADRFFSTAKESENLYESKLRMKSTSPTKVGQKDSSGLGGILSVLAGNLLSTLVKGGLIVGALALLGKGIKNFFEDPNFAYLVLELCSNNVSTSAGFLPTTPLLICFASL